MRFKSSVEFVYLVMKSGTASSILTELLAGPVQLPSLQHSSSKILLSLSHPIIESSGSEGHIGYDRGRLASKNVKDAPLMAFSS